MSDLLRLITETFAALWPLRLVREWERAPAYRFGRYRRTVGPGCYWVTPFFCELRPLSVVPQTWGTPLMTVTLRDGRSLTYSAMTQLRVEDAALALNAVQEWSETAMETVSGILSDQLADVDPDRFDPAYKKRGNLLKELRDEADAETRKFGVRVESIRFNNFAVGIRAMRLLIERSTFSDATIGAV